jgi:hypothetical protein
LAAYTEFELSTTLLTFARREGTRSRISDAIDNDYAIWRVDNHYWRLYFVDARAIDIITSAKVIRTIRNGHSTITTGGSSGGDELVSVDASGVEAAADWDSLQSPETYVSMIAL